MLCPDTDRTRLLQEQAENIQRRERERGRHNLMGKMIRSKLMENRRERDAEREKNAFRKRKRGRE